MKDYRPALMVVYAGIQSIIAENTKDPMDTKRGRDDDARSGIVYWSRDCINCLDRIMGNLDQIDECIAEIETRRRVS